MCFNLALKIIAIILKFYEVILGHYNSHSISITDPNSGRKEGRKEEKEKRKEIWGKKRNSEIWFPSLPQRRLGNIISLYAEEQETKW